MGSPSARPEGRIPPRWRDYFRLHRVQSPVRGHARHLRPQGRTGCEGWGVASRLPRHGICRHGPHGPRNPGSPCTKPHLPGPAKLPSSSKLLHPPISAMDGSNHRPDPPLSLPLLFHLPVLSPICARREKFIVSFFFFDKEFWEHDGSFSKCVIRGIFIVIIRSNVRDDGKLTQIENSWIRKGRWILYWKSSAN